MNRKTTVLSLLSLLSLGFFAAPARAELDGPIRNFERFAKNLKSCQISPLPVVNPRERRYGGSVGNQRVSIWVYLNQGRICGERIEVGIPPETADEYALAIMNRFFQEFVGSRQWRSMLDLKLRSMRKNIIDGGSSFTTRDMGNMRMTLFLDSKTREEMPNWLYWVGDIRRVR
ncbi:MAG TPA: hypothetical protein DD435_15760 [Cyanobacteria bacterium UBA8530]|nr:hypothetical protein [Cyanobacteria bacterium UBA8530]